MNSGRPETMENLPALYAIFQGEVAKSQTMEPLSKFQALGSKPSEIVDVGDKAWVKLIGRETRNDRIKLPFSMKVQEERQRRSFQDYTGQRITLEAVLNTACKKCGCKGYFAKDCFMQPEEKEKAKSAEFDPTRNSSRKRKEKNKHRDRKSSDSDSSDSESDTGKRTRQTSKDSKSPKKKTKKKRPKE
ncbi:hypothetical protein FD754_005018 [Muntiacus muntjak]|uniref:CCHC-type domain-containing protein n=1 Tax=Muntiacus muntjak TaxID=9888 RepID=A0A5N3WGG9_MUNMU|nr:hypothetical protein FD754_005018 [Muntiacus muntjak]